MITLLTDDPITQKRDFTGEFMFSPAPLDRENPEQNALARLSREQLAAFLEAEFDNVRSAHFNIPPAEPAPPIAEKGLALGVLKQAAYDLRRFRAATNGADWEVYLDAHTWLTAHDFSWPYSFMNVCKRLTSALKWFARSCWLTHHWDQSTIGFGARADSRRGSVRRSFVLSKVAVAPTSWLHRLEAALRNR
jgi:hypothetical protein